MKGDFGDAVPSWVVFISLVAYFVLGMITNSLLVYGSKKGFLQKEILVTSNFEKP